MPVKEQPTQVRANIENTPKLVSKQERAWAGWKPIIAGQTKQHKLDKRGRGKQPNKEAMGRKGVGGRPREDNGEVSVGLVRWWDRRRTDIRYIKLLVGVNHLKARSRSCWTLALGCQSRQKG
ncbi:hypothetical protein BY996DRAFT_6537805 [Phakopsora pachyrhizi]|nr:hypothetical protein BY996DRAFT_6537805 [Phakopsora pachyrhizi]